MKSENDFVAGGMQQLKNDVTAKATCRCCLAQVLDLFCVFSRLDEFNVKICDLISDCGGILISEYDTYSKYICGSCLKDLTNAARFRVLCLKTNYILRCGAISNEETVDLLQPQVIDLVESDDESVVSVDLQKQEESITGILREQRKSKIRANLILQFRHQSYEVKRRHKWRKLICQQPRDYPFACDRCDKVFKFHSMLTIHQRIHTGERPYQCSFCDKKFAQSGGLQVHERIHTGEKPFRCQVCRKTFRQKGQLTVHYSRNHG